MAREGAFHALMEKHGVQEQEEQEEEVEEGEAGQKKKDEDVKGEDEKERRVTDDEMRDEGAVEWKVYGAYMKAAGGCWIALAIVVAACAFESTRYASEWWLNHMVKKHRRLRCRLRQDLQKLCTSGRKLKKK